jgi:electron transfer flavoprotein alpha subunit
LTNTGDTTVSGARAGSTGGPDVSGAAAAAGLLLAVEPPGPGAPDFGPVLRAEGARIARALGLAVRTVTWESAAGDDVEALAGAVAEAAKAAAAAGPVAITAVLLADTDRGRRLAPLVAARLGSGAVLGCSDVHVEAGLVFVKPVYGGWLEVEVTAEPGTVPVVTLDLSGIEVPAVGAAAGEGAADTAEPTDYATAPAEVLTLKPGPAATPAVRRLEVIPPDARSVDLIHAKRIVSAGMGAADEELLAAVRELADLLGGSVGATRPVVDEGRLPKERLIGQTGRTVTPDLYVALGISGSPHHVAGVRKADTIMAVNRDPRAPIFQFSDVGYVADLREVLPALVSKIKEWRDAGE